LLKQPSNLESPAFRHGEVQNSIIKIDRDKIDVENSLLLVALFKNKNDSKIIDNIVRINIPIVLYVVASFGISRSSSSYDDFVAEGLFALSCAIKRYNKEKGKFSAYAFAIIRYKLLGCFNKYQNCVKLPSNKYLKLRRLIKSSFAEDREFTKEEEELFKLNFKYISDNDIDEANPSKAVFLDVEKYRETTQDSDEKQYAKDWYAILLPLLKRLNDREQLIINKIFGFDGQLISNFEEISKDIGVSTSRAKQLKDSIIKKLKRMMISKKMLIQNNDRFGFGDVEINSLL